MSMTATDASIEVEHVWIGNASQVTTTRSADSGEFFAKLVSIDSTEATRSVVVMPVKVTMLHDAESPIKG